MRGCRGDVGHAWLPGGACVVAGGCAWLLGVGMHGFGGG